MSFLDRFIFAWVYLFRLLADGLLASRTKALLEGRFDPGTAVRAEPTSDAVPARKSAETSPDAIRTTAASPVTNADRTTSAAMLLSLFQREGRLIDFLEQDITEFTDGDVGVAARVVHEGCRKALRQCATLTPVRAEEEGARVSVDGASLKSQVKLTGNVSGSPPFQGALRHRGWKVDALTLPVPTEDADPHVLAPAEVEL
jgi:hypothetical protein